MGEKDYEVTYKILILGDSGVGKTCLIFRFIENIFSDSYISTIGKLVVLQSCKETCIFDDDLQNKLDLVYEKRKLINQNKMFLAESKEEICVQISSILEVIYIVDQPISGRQ